MSALLFSARGCAGVRVYRHPVGVLPPADHPRVQRRRQDLESRLRGQRPGQAQVGGDQACGLHPADHHQGGGETCSTYVQ